MKQAFMKGTGRQTIGGRPIERIVHKTVASTLPQNSSEDLIRLLANRLLSSRVGIVEPTDSTAEDILFDSEIDGVRYLLIRMPKADKFQLSPREQEIVRMVAEGHPNKIIADVLSISSWTVCTHLRRIFAKLGVGSRAAMVARLFEAGKIRGKPRLP
jgi:DNA-binding CsgD family transcriptional regulator